MKGRSQPWSHPLLLILLTGIIVLLPHCVVGNQTGQPCQTSADCSGRTPRCFDNRCVYCSQDADCPSGQICVRTGVIASCQTKDAPQEPISRTEPPPPRRDSGLQEPPASDKATGEPGVEPSHEPVHPPETAKESQQDRSDGGTTEQEPADTPSETAGDEPTPEDPADTKDEIPDPGVCQMGQGRSCYTGPMGTNGVGACKSGAQLCINGMWGPCQGQVTPSKESCDGLDNNCNGVIDEGDPGSGQSCNSGKKGICAAGTTQCSQGKLACISSQSPQAESCNGKDDNCDGRIDDGNPGGGKSCNSGRPGECAAGTTQCSRGQITCAANQAPKAESCNGKDDDCDGQTDEGNPGGGASCSTSQRGECRAGKLQCSNGRLVCTAINQPTAEVCDGKDNDCDGLIDDNIAQKTCYILDGSYCRRGTSACTNGATTCQNTQVQTCTDPGDCAACPGGASTYRCTIRIRRCVKL